MSEVKYKLKKSIRIEPIVFGWYAWPQLISPLTAAFNLLNRHLKVMTSFVDNPELHRQGAKNITGGSFIDLDDNSLELIKQLIIRTQVEGGTLLQLAKDIIFFDQLLQEKANGYSLEELYQALPDQLKGMVELVYDAHNNPSIRFIENLFYTRYSLHADQQILIADTVADYRPFSLSNPRLCADNEILLAVDFKSDVIGQVISLKNEAKTREEIFEILKLPTDKIKVLENFLVEDDHQNLTMIEPLEKEKIRVRYFGHACVLLETCEVSILLDPLISYAFDSTLPRFTFEHLPKVIDYVLFTHAHDDHVVLETLLQIRHKIKNIILPKNNKGFLLDPSVRLMLISMGFKARIFEIEELDEVAVPDGVITGVPFLGEHCDFNIQSKIGYYIKLHDKTFVFVADSNNVDPKIYYHTFNHLGKADVLFIGMECVGAPLKWLYGPLMTSAVIPAHNKSRRLSGSDAEKAKKLLDVGGFTEAYIYAMGREPWLNYIMALDYSDKSIQLSEAQKFMEHCIEKNIKTCMPYVKHEWLYNGSC